MLCLGACGNVIKFVESTAILANGNGDERQSLKAAGRAEFDQARFLAFWSEVRDLLLNRPVGLLSFNEVKARLHLTEQVYHGLQNVPLDRIVGSVGRYKDFTRNFLPKYPQMSERWSRVYAHMNDLEGVPPIEVYLVGDVYFVKDGNHRVSIARKMKLDSIEAHVTELKTPIHLEPNVKREQLDTAAAYADFLDQTRLDQTRPKQAQIKLSEARRYNDLLEHIRLVQRLMEHQRGYEVSLEQASVRWYDLAYAPMVRLIREYNILSQFPGRTEADLYVWISEHFQRLLETYGEGASETTLSNAMVDFLAAHRIPVPKRLLTSADDPLMSGSA